VETIEGQHVVELQDTDAIGAAFNALISHHVHSAPVYSKAQGRYVGLVDLKDFVSYVLSLMTNNPDAHPSNQVGSLVDFSHQDPFHSLPHTATIMEALKLFGSQHRSFRIHRIPIVDDSGKVIKMLSQSSLVAWVGAHLADTWQALRQPIRDLQCGTPKVFTVKDSDLLRDAFHAIIHNGINGAGVVDHNGDLVGNLSLTDLQFSVEKNFPYFGRTVGEFLHDCHPARPLVTCTASSTVADVINLLTSHHLHRIYIVPSDTRDVGSCGVVTLTDIIDTVLLVALGEVISEIV
jgi:CBS domain-containing protein